MQLHSAIVGQRFRFCPRLLTLCKIRRRQRQ